MSRDVIPTLTLRSTRYVDDADDRLHEVAEQRAGTDAKQGADIEPLPNSSMLLLNARHGTLDRGLGVVQREEAAAAHLAWERATARQARLDDWADLDHLPDDVGDSSGGAGEDDRGRRLRALRRLLGRLRGLMPPRPLILPLLGVVAVLLAETVLLVDPINQILDTGIGFTLAASSAAAMVTGLAALVAHVRAKKLASADAATYGQARDTAAAAADLATVGLLVTWAAAIVARGHMSWQANDRPAILFFALAQTLFLVAGLLLPRWLLETRRNLNEAQLKKIQERATAAASAAAAHRDLVAEEHGQQHQRLAVALRSAHRTYLCVLADHHPDSWIADQLRAVGPHIDLGGPDPQWPPPWAAPEGNGEAGRDTDTNRTAAPGAGPGQPAPPSDPGSRPSDNGSDGGHADRSPDRGEPDGGEPDEGDAQSAPDGFPGYTSIDDLLEDLLGSTDGAVGGES